MRTVTATRTNQWCIWGQDSGGWAYRFGMRDMTATEHVRAVVAAGKPVDSRRLFDECIAIELPDGAAYPETITIELIERAEWFATQRSAA